MAWLLSIGGIEVRAGVQLSRDIMLDALRADCDAVFLGLGLTGVNALGIAEPAGPEGDGLADAVDWIAVLRQSANLARGRGRHVVVIGGGMTAIDAAVQSKMLGAETATIVYRRGPESTPASMSRKGDCWDNAPTESVFNSLKNERVHATTYAARADAQTDLFEYIEVFYNRSRRHSTLGYSSPVRFLENWISEHAAQQSQAA